MNDMQLRFLKPKNTKYSITDKGLIISVYPSGTITFSCRIMESGKRKFITIGNYPDVSLKEARQFVDNLKTSSDDNRKIKFKSFAFIAEKFRAENPQIQSSYFDHLNEVVISHYGNSQCENIKPFIVKELIEGSTLSPLNRTLVLSLLRRILDYAVNLGYAEYHKCQNVNKLIIDKHTGSHFKSLDWRNLAELQVYYDKLSVRAKCFLICVLFLNIRTKEISSLTWNMLDTDNQCFIVPAEVMKMKREFRVPVTPTFSKILNDRFNHNFSSLFGYRKMCKETLTTKLAEIGFPYTVHGFRATFRTWCADNNVRFEVAETCLSHQEKSAVVRAYSRSDYLEERREVMTRWQEYVMSQLKL